MSESYPAKNYLPFVREAVAELTPEEHRAKWLKRLVDELDKIEPLLPIKILPDGV